MADKQLIDATVTRARGMTLAGVHHEQGATVPMDEGHFADLGPAGLGWVDRAPAKPAKADKATKPADPAA